MQDVIVNRRPSKLAAGALEVARTQLGIREHPLGSNDGPEVRDYLKSVKLGPGYAWCAAFMFWCHERAAAAMKASNPLPRTGGVMAMFNEAKGRNIVKLEAPLHPDALRPGDIFILQFPHGQGHTGIIDKITGDTVITIEGNTNANGSREGIGVYSKRRAVSGLRGIIRLID